MNIKHLKCEGNVYFDLSELMLILGNGECDVKSKSIVISKIHLDNFTNKLIKPKTICDYCRKRFQQD